MWTSRFARRPFGDDLTLRLKALGSLLATVAIVTAAAVAWISSDSGVRGDAPPAATERFAIPLTPWPEVSSTPKAVGRGAVASLVLRTASNLGSGEDPVLLAARIARRGVGRVWVQFKQDESDEVRGGEVFYPSALAPVAQGFEDGRLRRFIVALRRHGIEVAAWVPALQDEVAWHDHPEWRAQKATAEGGTEEQVGWLCPRHPKAIAHEAAILAEIAHQFRGQLSGVYTDFIRYDDDLSCVCPICRRALALRHNVPQVSVADVVLASERRGPLWLDWTTLRSDSIHDALDQMRDHLDTAAPGIWFGASVLPFSAEDYSLNTQAGQDLAKMSRAGVDEIVLMGYWDDWGKSPGWLSASLDHAQVLVHGEAQLSVLLDGDMSVRRTMKTLEAVASTEAAQDPEDPIEVAWFHYGAWSEEVFATLDRATARLHTLGRVPRATYTAVAIRIDTEPDAGGRYATVSEPMIAELLDLFQAEGVKATFVTVGKLAEQQSSTLRRALAEGHEIAGHGYDHEQIDDLPEDDQIRVVDRTVETLRALGFRPHGFGAPRNSITDIARDRLIERGLFYDGSAAYDPLLEYHDVQLVSHTTNPRAGILVIPFIIPNDWDARFLAKQSANEMLAAWRERLTAVVDAGEPTFVLDIHQWIASQPDNLAAVREFLRTAKACPSCRVGTLNEAAHHALEELRRAEGSRSVSSSSPAHTLPSR